MNRILWTAIALSITALSGCKLNSPMPPPAPVLERPIQSSPGLSPNKASATEVSTHKPIPLGPHQYLVQKGDTLYAISKKLGIPLPKLAELNHLTPPFALQVGQILTVSTKGTPATAAATTAANEDAEVVTGAIGQPPGMGAENTLPSPATNETTPSKTTAVVSVAPPATSTDLDTVSDSTLDWQWPLRGKVTTQFDGQTNKGVNIVGNAGQVVTVSSAGKVIYSGIDIRGYGKLVIVKHNSNLLSVYAHHGVSLVKEGAFVAVNDKIATLPATQPQQPVLHFEIRQKGKPVDPLTFLPAAGNTTSN